MYVLQVTYDYYTAITWSVVSSSSPNPIFLVFVMYSHGAQHSIARAREHRVSAGACRTTKQCEMNYADGAKIIMKIIFRKKNKKKQQNRQKTSREGRPETGVCCARRANGLCAWCVECACRNRNVSIRPQCRAGSKRLSEDHVPIGRPTATAAPSPPPRWRRGTGLTARHRSAGAVGRGHVLYNIRFFFTPAAYNIVFGAGWA